MDGRQGEGSQRSERPRRLTLRRPLSRNERLPIFLYIPKHVRPAFQVVVFFPGSLAFMTRDNELDSLDFGNVEFIIRSGRVVVVPVYKGAMERNDEESTTYRIADEAMETRRYADYLVKLVKDFNRTLDYLETRGDFDNDRIGYFGFSEGGLWAPILLTAAEGRVKAAVLELGAL